MTNPLFNNNRLKLGLFGLNAGHHIMTKAPERYLADWARCDGAVGLADELGIEVAVSLVGWSPQYEFEPFAWATALGARHPNLAVISTMHVQLNHPTFVAKAAATIDHVTGGRFGINLVAGSNPQTYGAFGTALEDHETRYAHATEFIEALRLIWSAEKSVSFEGRFFKFSNVMVLPRPVQPFPAIMNAGTSGRGKDFACKYADMVFTHPPSDMAEAKGFIEDYKRHARESFGRNVQVWTHGYVVIRETEAEANEFLNYYAVEHADQEAVRRWVAALGAASDSAMSAADRWKFDRNWAAGGGASLVGTADQVAEKLERLSNAGLDGILLNTIEPETMLHHVGKSLLPRLEAKSLRRPVKRA